MNIASILVLKLFLLVIVYVDSRAASRHSLRKRQKDLAPCSNEGHSSHHISKGDPTSNQSIPPAPAWFAFPLAHLRLIQHQLQAMQCRPRIILFKTPLEPDPYSDTLGSEYEVEFIPVLQETYVVEELKTVLRGGGGGWEAVIVSSKRGAGGYIAAAAAVDAEAESQRSNGAWSMVILTILSDL
jgi:hypothetical protein